MNLRKSDRPGFHSWRRMMRRCHDKNDRDFKDYGAKGISVCNRWRGKHGFFRFVMDMGRRPFGHSIERINNKKGYSPSNCRWANPIEQSNNRKCNIRITHDGLTLNLSQWAEKLNVSYNKLYYNVVKKGDRDYIAKLSD